MPSGSSPISCGRHFRTNEATTRTTIDITPSAMALVCQCPAAVAEDTNCVVMREPGSMAHQTMPMARPRRFTNQLDGMPVMTMVPPRADPTPMTK